MDSFVSAVAARIVFVEGTDVKFVDAENPTQRKLATISEIPALMADAYDVVRLKNTTEEKSFKQLLEGWNADRALRMLDIILDSESEQSEIEQAGHYFSELIANDSTKEFVKNYTLAMPLGAQLESRRVFDVLTRESVALAFVNELLERQEDVHQVRVAWDRISESVFDGTKRKSEFEAAAVAKGAFRKIVEALGDANAVKNAVLECYLMLSGQPGARAVIGAWTKDLVERPVRRKLGRLERAVAEEDIQGDADFHDVARPYDAFQGVRKQQDAIIRQMELGNNSLARRFTDQLITWQLQNGGAEYAAMSLCLLAQAAKKLGHRSVQLEWVQRAVELAPEDARTHGQAGDAYLGLFRLDEAATEFEAARRLSNDPFGRTGLARVLRARGKLDDALITCVEIELAYANHPEVYHAWALHCEILRDMWRLEEALLLYKKSAVQFSEQSIFWCGVGSVLKDMGRLTEALDAFSTAAARFEYDPVSRGGRADTLKLMGDVDGALREYDSAIEKFPNEATLSCGRADVLRTMGNYSDALRLYQGAINRFPFEPAAYCGYADTQKDAGNFSEALVAYDQAVLRFESEPRCRTGRANVLKTAGYFSDALQAFDQCVRDFPYDLYSLTSRAGLLKLLGSYRDALDAYDAIVARRPDYVPAKFGKAAVQIALGQFGDAERLLPIHPSTTSEWIGYHIRGILMLKRNLIEEAVAIFLRGSREVHDYRIRRSFEISLAAARIRQQKFTEAVELVKDDVSPVSQVLWIHSLAAMGRMKLAREAYSSANDNVTPSVIELREAIAARFGLQKKSNIRSEQWIFDQETEVLLQAA